MAEPRESRGFRDFKVNRASKGNPVWLVQPVPLELLVQLVHQDPAPAVKIYWNGWTYKMPITPKVLADGQVAATKTVIYTVPAATNAVIRTVAFVNVAATTETVQLYVTPSGGTSRKFSRATIGPDEFAHEEDIGTLETGDALEAETNNATSVDFSVMGVEET